MGHLVAGTAGLRQVLAREGVTDPLWYKVRKNRKASKYTRSATPEGADLRTLGRVAVSGGGTLAVRRDDGGESVPDPV